jgi:alpha-L-rhamnosidase
MSTRVYDLKTNNRREARGIDSPKPEFAWKFATSAHDAIQTAYTIQVSSEEGFNGKLVWDTGKITSSEQFGIVYAGHPLRSMLGYFWRVRIWDASDTQSDWSETAYFETAALDSFHWAARWISSERTSKNDKATLYLRGSVDLPAPILKARAYVSALGWYRLFVNGHDMTGNALVPRFTPFDKIVEYQTYDVTEQLQSGMNIIGITVGDGRYRGHLGVMRHRAVYGNRLAAFAQIHMELADGTKSTFATNEQWVVGTGRIIESDPIYGERVDLNISNDDWMTAPEPPPRFTPAHILPPSPRKLIAEEVNRVQEVERLPAKRMLSSPSGKQIIDFGQNLAGYVRIKLTGTKGTKIRLTHSEVVRQDGELDTNYLLPLPWALKPTAEYDEVLLSGESCWFQPWFTIHGFRYVEIDGLEYKLELNDIQAVALSSDLSPVGTFECSDSRLNQFHRNVFWSLRSNFTDTPTDCPTRERSGWTGDIQVFSPTATKYVDSQAFLRRYLRNITLEQFPNGTLPSFIPSESSAFSGGMSRMFRYVSTSTGWGDASVFIPWTLYQYYGDRLVLECQYESSRRWVDHLEHEARNNRGRGRWFAQDLGDLENYIMDSGYHWGEWLRPGEGLTSIFWSAVIPNAVVATAYFAQSSYLLSEIATILDDEQNASHYAKLSEKVRIAWRAAFVRDDGHRIGEDKQEDYVRALAFNLITSDQRHAALNRLVELIEQNDNHLATGLLSTRMLLPVLAENGRPDVAMNLLLQDTQPSWLSQIERGATTIWETWEGYDKHGKAWFSQNHYGLGAIAGWLQEGIAGLSPIAPGYRRFRVAPLVAGGLTYATATIETPFGYAKSAWRVTDSIVKLEVIVPPGTSANIYLGNGCNEQVGSGTHHFEWNHL